MNPEATIDRPVLRRSIGTLAGLVASSDFKWRWTASLVGIERLVLILLIHQFVFSVALFRRGGGGGGLEKFLQRRQAEESKSSYDKFWQCCPTDDCWPNTMTDFSVRPSQFLLLYIRGICPHPFVIVILLKCHSYNECSSCTRYMMSNPPSTLQGSTTVYSICYSFILKFEYHQLIDKHQRSFPSISEYKNL